MQDLNLELFRWVNGWPSEMAPFWRFWSEATQRSEVRALLIALVVGMVARGPRSRWAILLAMLSWPLANFLCDLWKYGLQGPRPFQVLDGVLMRAGKSSSFGTASAHSANMAAVAFCLTRGLGWWGVPWIVVAVLVGISRVYVGVHFPYQVLLGWLTGAAAAWAVTEVAQRIRDRRNPVGDLADDQPEQA